MRYNIIFNRENNIFLNKKSLIFVTRFNKVVIVILGRSFSIFDPDIGPDSILLVHFETLSKP